MGVLKRKEKNGQKVQSGQPFLPQPHAQPPFFFLCSSFLLCSSFCPSEREWCERVRDEIEMRDWERFRERSGGSEREKQRKGDGDWEREKREFERVSSRERVMLSVRGANRRRRKTQGPCNPTEPDSPESRRVWQRRNREGVPREIRPFRDPPTELRGRSSSIEFRRVLRQSRYGFPAKTVTIFCGSWALFY
jgi:hypothetical protein